MALDLDPALGVGAPEGLQGGLPLVGAAVALGTVGMGRDGPELRTGDIVGETFALVRGPLRGAGLADES